MYCIKKKQLLPSVSHPTLKNVGHQSDYYHLDGAEVHGVLDDVMVVMEAKSFYVNRFVEGPGVCHVFFGQHLSDEACAGTQLFLTLRR